jgi:hypothetical protein
VLVVVVVVLTTMARLERHLPVLVALVVEVEAHQVQ